MQNGGPVEPARREAFAVECMGLGEPVRGSVWSPPGLEGGHAAGMLVVHDGPAYDSEASLTGYVADLVASGELPALRVALLEAGPRTLWYTANFAYATALADDVVPALREGWLTSRTIGMGASLGGLAWLHAQSSYPEVVDGLFLQSGSYFRPDTDAQESGFSEFPAIVRFVRSVRRGRRPTRPVPTVMTCGVEEENLENNRRMARVLTRLGYQVRLVQVPGGHDYPSWRAAFDPHLPDLVHATVGSAVVD